MNDYDYIVLINHTETVQDIIILFTIKSNCVLFIILKF